MLEKRQKEKLPALRDIPKQTLLEKNAKVDKCLCEFKLQRLQIIKDYFMQELLLLQIVWD